MSAIWSKPFYGLQHYGNTMDVRRCSVQEGNGFVLLHLWRRVDGGTAAFEERKAKTVEDAKAEGEAWVKEGSK